MAQKRPYSPTGNWLWPHNCVFICFPILFLFFQVEMTNLFQRTLVENNLFMSLPQLARACAGNAGDLSEAIYKHRRWASCTHCFFLLLFPLLFYSFLFMRVSKFLPKGDHVSVKLLIPLIHNKVLCPFQCKIFSGCLCFFTTSFLVNSLHTWSVATAASELNVAENHINVISVVMKWIQYTP